MDRQPATFGVSAAAMIERHMSFLLRRFRVDVKDGAVNLAELAEMHDGLELQVERGAPREQQLEYVAIQLGCVACKFEMPERPVTLFSDRERREYARVVDWAAEALIPDAAMHAAEREGWDDRTLAAECEVTLRLARHRIRCWKRRGWAPVAPSLDVVVELRATVPAASADGIRYEEGRRIKGLKVPIPEDRERVLREFSRKYSGKGRF